MSDDSVADAIEISLQAWNMAYTNMIAKVRNRIEDMENMPEEFSPEEKTIELIKASVLRELGTDVLEQIEFLTQEEQ